MKSIWKWILGIAAVLVVLFALPFLFGGLFGYGGMMGGWGHPMMFGYGYSPLGGLFMGFGMLLAWGIPLSLLGLVIYGAVRLTNTRNSVPIPTRTCPNCKKPAQQDWTTCPYCGTSL